MPTKEQSDDIDRPIDRPLRPLTEQLINAVLLDVWPGNAAIIDFGIDSSSHLGALQFAIKHGEVTPQELDAAMGNGAKLTEIAQRGDNPYRDVVFHTSWDKMRLEPLDEPAGEDNEALFTETASDPGVTTVQIMFERILHGTPEQKTRGSVEMEIQSPKDMEHER